MFNFTPPNAKVHPPAYGQGKIMIEDKNTGQRQEIDRTCGSAVKRLVMWFKRMSCKHEFKLKHLTLTGIKPLQKPTSGDYHAWEDYYRKYYDHDSNTKRVWWPCHKCWKGFYAHCGLSITHNKVVVIVDT